MVVLMCDLKQIHKKRAKVPDRFKGHKSAGLCAESVEFHDSMQIAMNNFTFYRSISFNLGHFDQS
jgi:hypothetical protein